MVVYDQDGRYQNVCASLEDERVRVVDASSSSITSRLAAIEALQDIGRPKSTLDAVLTVYGVPSVAPQAGGNGYRIERSYFTLDGEVVSPDTVTRNTRLAVVLTVTSSRDDVGRLMINDPLPAGFEIDNPNLLKSGSVQALDWIDAVEDVQMVEFRTDRFLAAVDNGGRKQFRLAYIVRAVSPGDFHHPAATVEDMYRPRFRAWTGTGRIRVIAEAR